MTYHIDETPEIEVEQLSFSERSVFIKLLVNDITFYTEVCKCCGQLISVGCTEGSDLIDKYYDDIEEFINCLIFYG